MSEFTRRDFLRSAALGVAGGALAVPATARAPLGKARSCIFINMVGGPAHLDTFDPKPNAPSDVRGPFAPIQTKVPGIHLSALFPKLAALTDKFSLIRSMHHDAPPVHECGFQLLNTGRLFRDGPEWPSVGSVASFLKSQTLADGPWVLPSAAVETGILVSHGMGAGFLSSQIFPAEFSWTGDGDSAIRFAADLLKAQVLTESGAHFVTVNQFSTVFDAPSWDCHADGGSLRTTLKDVANVVAPSFDTAFAQLLTDLEDRGLLETTLVVATGEFGRTPKLNSNGGRDHWAGCWTALVAGGGIKGGVVLGNSDKSGSEPAERPVTPQELVSTVFHALGVSPDATIPGPDGTPVAVYPAAPVGELF